MNIDSSQRNKIAYLNRDLSKLNVKTTTSIDEAKRLENLEYVLRNLSMKNLINKKNNEVITDTKSNRRIK